MKKLILPIAAIVLGGAGGVAAAYIGRDEAVEDHPELAHEAEAPCGEPVEKASGAPVAPIETGEPTEYAVIGKQFLVPVIEEDRLAAMMLLSLSVEVPEGQADLVYDKEPRVRDALLQDLFAHANIGGFAGNYTESDKMLILRRDLLSSVRDIVGEAALDVLVLDIVRQEL